MAYRFAFFDFDGTLANTFPWLVRLLNRLAADYGFDAVHAEDVESLRGFGAKRVLRHLGVAPWKVPRIAQRMRAMIAADIHEVRLFEGADPMLRTLASEGVALALVSSNDRSNIEKVMGPAQMDFFQHVECGVSVFGKAKKLRRTLEVLEADPREAIYVGDEIRDIEAAHQAGMAAGAVAWGYNRIEALEEQNPQEVFRSMEEIGHRVTGSLATSRQEPMGFP